MHLDIEKAGNFAGYSRSAIIKGFQLATERACRRYFRTSRCSCDSSNDVVHIDFILPKDRHALNQIKETHGISFDSYDRLVPVALQISKLPQRILRMTKTDLIEAVNACQEREVYDQWKSRENTVVEGVVVYDTDDEFIEVDVNGKTCIFQKRYWIAEEVSFLYRKGKTAMFHVLRVSFREGESSCSIILSRRSLILPQLLLKTNLPIYNFKCDRRFPGRKCWITTNAPLNEKSLIEARKATSLELSGEIIEIANG